MNYKLKFEDNSKLKFLFLAILYFIFFYFFIFKNVLTYFELKEYISTENIKIQKLNIENAELKNSLIFKKKNLEKALLSLNETAERTDNKLSFSKISDVFHILNKYIEKNNIVFDAFGRSQKNGNIRNISFTFKATEEDSINFFKDLENSNYYFKLSNSHFSLISLNNQILCKISIQFKVTNIFKKVSIENNNIENIFLQTSKRDKNSSYMRIGNNKFYGTNNHMLENNSSQEIKTLKKD